MLAADWLLLGTGLSFAADTIGFFGFVTLGLLTAFSFRRNWYRLGAIVLLTALAFGWIGIESHSERLGYRLFVARHRGALESTAQHPDSIRDLDSMLGTINVHAQISSNDAAAFMIDNDDFNSQGCLIYAPDSAPSYETLYRLGLHWITVEPRHLTGNWYYCEEAVE
jgi:hypothetical protein